VNAVATNYYQSVIGATEVFLGPAAKRFVDRQIDFHLSKDPETINRQDVIRLRDSLGVALGLLVDDKRIVDDAVHRFDDIIKK
jgi:hypothetical protein